MSKKENINSKDGSKATKDLSSVNWSFPEADVDEGAHGIHPYPAQMVPDIADYLIEYFLELGIIQKGDWVYDPFSGSGTTGVEARRHGLNSKLVDVNPLACMIAQVKADPPNPTQVESAKNELYGGQSGPNLRAEVEGLSPSEEDYKVDLGSNYDWFPEPQLSQLGLLKDRIKNLSQKHEENVVRFFRVALSETSRRVSYQRNGEFKRYRIPEDDREEFDPDVWDEFDDIIVRNQRKARKFYEEVDTELETEVYRTDARQPESVKRNSADLVITSPPYGDHQTTVAYGQFSTDPAVIAKDESPSAMRRIDDKGLGGSATTSGTSEDPIAVSESLESTYQILDEKDGRSKDALEFFSDYYSALKETSNILRPSQPMVLVVANRTMSRVNIPTHQITVEFCEHLGFKTDHVLPRSIPRKTLPFENNPGGVSEESGEMMADEYILMFRNS